MRHLNVYAHPDHADVARGYAAGQDIEDELVHHVVVTELVPPGQMYITDKSRLEMEQSLRDELGSQTKGDT